MVRDIILGARKYSAIDTFRAMYKLEELRAEAAGAWKSVDVLLLPTTGTTYRIAEVEADPIRLNSNLGYYTNFVNLLNLAALAIPAGFRPNGLPFGVTLMAPSGKDWGLLDLAARLEETRVTVVGAHLSGAAAEPAVDRARGTAGLEGEDFAGVPAICAGQYDTAEAGAGAGAGVRRTGD